jgi:hypothetical protein
MMAANAKSYNREKMIEVLLADDNPHSTPQSRCKCIVGKYNKDDDSKCRKIAERIADFALKDEFNRRVQDLRVCVFPQHFACCLRLMIDDLMRLLPPPACPEDARGADDIANFQHFLWTCVIVPVLMTNGDASYFTGPLLANGSSCSRMFVKFFTAQLYGFIGENVAMQTEVNYIIEKLPEQIEMHSRMSYEATNKPKFEAIKKKLLSNDGSILMEFLAALDARCVRAQQLFEKRLVFLLLLRKRIGFCVQTPLARFGQKTRSGKYAAETDFSGEE